MANKLEMVAVPSHLTKDAKQFAPPELFRSLSFWGQLSESEQRVVQTEGQQLAAAMILGGISDLAKGEHLAKLNEILEPKRCFVKFLGKFTRISPKQAYRYINGWNNARARLTDPVLKLAMTRNMRILGDSDTRPLGVYTKAVEAMGPPPRSEDPAVAGRWLDGVEQTRKEQRLRKKTHKGKVIAEVTGDPEFTLIEAFRYASKRVKTSGATARLRVRYLEKLVGMLMTDAGIASSVSFEPHAIPDKYRPNPVGRPTLVKGEVEAEA